MGAVAALIMLSLFGSAAWFLGGQRCQAQLLASRSAA